MATTSMTPPEPDTPDPFGPTGDRAAPPFIVNGRDPSTDPDRDADERLAWMEAQQAVMNGKSWRRPE